MSSQCYGFMSRIWSFKVFFERFVYISKYPNLRPKSCAGVRACVIVEENVATYIRRFLRGTSSYEATILPRGGMLLLNDKARR